MGAKPPLAYAHLFILLAYLSPLFHCAQYAETAFLDTKDRPWKTSLPLKASSLSCDFFHGSWIYNDSYPLYDSAGCGFIDPEFDCLKYGRPDKLYLKYSWKPTNCELPRFDGKDLLTRWIGKKIMFVGDSISYNQWQSLLCMLTASVPSSNTASFKKDPLSSIRFEAAEGVIKKLTHAFVAEKASSSRLFNGKKKKKGQQKNVRRADQVKPSLTKAKVPKGKCYICQK